MLASIEHYMCHVCGRCTAIIQHCCSNRSSLARRVPVKIPLQLAHAGKCCRNTRRHPTMAPDGGKVDLRQLKERLSRLGVHLDAVPGETAAQSSSGGSQVLAQATAPLLRGTEEVTRLLERCNRIENALKSPHHAPAASSYSPHHHSTTSVPATSSRSPPRSALASAAAAVAAAAATGEVSRYRQQAASADRAPAQRRGVPLGHAAAASSSRSRGVAVVSTAAAYQQQQAAAQQRHDARGTPLATVLAQYKEAQAAWAHEKAKLRRDAVSSRKRAAALELELARVSKTSAHRGADLTNLKAALKGRDVALADAHAKVKSLEEALAKAHEVAAEKLCSLAAERDDLQGLLLATLQRLEAVEGAVAAADASSAAMEDKVAELERERLAALEVAATARGQVESLSAAQAKLQWQSRLLEKMSQVQTQHNKRKSAAIRELLEQDATAAAVAGAGQEMSEGQAAAGAGRGARQATTDLFAGILAGRGQADGGEDSSDAESTDDGSMLADLAPLLQALKG